MIADRIAPRAALRAAALSVACCVAPIARAETTRAPPPTSEITLATGGGMTTTDGAHWEPAAVVSIDLRVGEGPVVFGAVLDLGKGLIESSDKVVGFFGGVRTPLGETLTLTTAAQGALHFFERCPLFGTSCDSGSLRAVGVRLALERFTRPRSPTLGFWLSYLHDLGTVPAQFKRYGGPMVVGGVSFRLVSSD